MKNLMGVLAVVQLRRSFLLIGVLLACVLLWNGRNAVQASEPIEVGYRDFTYPSGVSGNSEVTAEKPESKLWWNDGFWWASMWSTDGNAYHIYKLNWTTQTWEDTGTQLDDRKDTKADTLWDGEKLYVVSHIWSGNATSTSAGQRGELFRYSYSAGTYSLDAGFPVEVSGGDAEALVIDKDSTGMLWVTYVQDEKVYVNHSQVGDDTAWATPYVLPVGNDANVTDDDLSSIIAYDGHVGVMWSSQTSGSKMLFAVHVDGADANTWQSVTAFSTSGDDHINLKSLAVDSSGKVFAVVKTSKSATLIMLLVCDNGDCTTVSDWNAHLVYGSSEGSPTRPALLIDTTNRDLYVFARVNDDIYYKRSDIDNIDFPTGLGEPFIKSATDTGINDPTTTKQSVSNATGIVVLASDSQKRTYFHNCFELSGPSSMCLEANPAPGVQFGSATYNVNENNSPTMQVTVELSQPMVGAVSVDYVIQDVSATAGADYTVASANGTLSFAPSETSKTIDFAIIDDTLDEGDETVSLTLSNAIGIDLGSPDTALLTIVDDDAPPTINFASATYSVAENGGQATIDLTLSHASDTAVTVNYATANGTAVAGSDYTAIPATTMTFNPGEISKSFNVAILDDVAAEPDETVQLSLSNPSVNATLGAQATATLTILDDTQPSVRFSSAAFNELENAGFATITVELSVPFSGEVSVNYATADNTAVAGSDYEASNGTLTFAPGITSQNFTVNLIDNAESDVSKVVDLALSNPVNAVLSAPSAAALTITDDEGMPTVALEAATYQGDENDGMVTITINLSSPSAQTVSVAYTTSDGTAVAGDDYTTKAGILTFPPQTTSQNIEIPILNDEQGEGPETFKLTLSNPEFATLGTPNETIVTIIDDDAPPSVTFSSATYNTTEDAGQITIMAQLNQASAQALTVGYETADGTAQAGNDYQAASGEITFEPGQVSQSFIVEIINDDENEVDETVSLSLIENNVDGRNITAHAVLMIEDDDRPLVQYSAANYEKFGPGMATIMVTLSEPAVATLTVDYATSDGTAVAGSDYTATNGTLIFEPGTMQKSFYVPIIVDNPVISEKTINLSLSDPFKAELGLRETAVLTIRQPQMIFLPFIGN